MEDVSPLSEEAAPTLLLFVKNDPPLLPATREKLRCAVREVGRFETNRVARVEEREETRELVFVVHLKDISDIITFWLLALDLRSSVSRCRFDEEVHAELRSRLPVVLAEQFHEESRRAQRRPPPIFDDIGDDLEVTP